MKVPLRKQTLILVFSVIGAVPLGSHFALARPANFIGSYRILQSRILALSHGRGYVLQDGNLVANAAINHARPYCRAEQTTFDDVEGDVDVSFDVATDGTEHALLRTIPSTASHRATTVDCVARDGFSGILDLSIALGRVVELSR